jgi:hypothetical protein
MGEASRNSLGIILSLLLALSFVGGCFASPEGTSMLLHHLFESDLRGPAGVSEVKAFIAAGADLNAQDKWGYSPLTRAAEYGQTGIIKLLIKAGGNLNTKVIFDIQNLT